MNLKIKNREDEVIELDDITDVFKHDYATIIWINPEYKFDNIHFIGMEYIEVAEDVVIDISNCIELKCTFFDVLKIGPNLKKQIENWNVEHIEFMSHTFNLCGTKLDLSKWYFKSLKHCYKPFKCSIIDPKNFKWYNDFLNNLKSKK